MELVAAEYILEYVYIYMYKYVLVYFDMSQDGLEALPKK